MRQAGATVADCASHGVTAGFSGTRTSISEGTLSALVSAQLREEGAQHHDLLADVARCAQPDPRRRTLAALALVGSLS